MRKYKHLIVFLSILVLAGACDSGRAPAGDPPGASRLASLLRGEPEAGYTLADDRYPMGWTLSVPSRDLVLEIHPVIEAQELDTNVRYREGAVDVSGRSGGEPIDGRGYVELTGYAR